MFDISFGELMIIGVVALIVIGPQRLPGVARTLGHLIGRAQRYVNDVKRDIQKEIDLDELNKVKTQMETAARAVQADVRDAAASFTQPVEDAQAALHDAAQSVKDSVKLDVSLVAPQVAASSSPAAPAASSAQPTAISNPKEEPSP